MNLQIKNNKENSNNKIFKKIYIFYPYKLIINDLSNSNQRKKKKYK